MALLLPCLVVTPHIFHLLLAMSFEFAGKPIKCRAAVAWEAAKPLCKNFIGNIL